MAKRPSKKRQRIARRSRRKGKGFERKVAEMVLAAFADHGMGEEDCYRTPNSGGHRQSAKLDPGDLVISPRLRELFPFHVECKNQKALEVFHFFVPFEKHKSTWSERQWIDQAIDAERRSSVKDLHPLLVFKKNNCPVLCAVPLDYDPARELVGRRMVMKFKYKTQQWILCRFATLLEAVKRSNPC